MKVYFLSFMILIVLLSSCESKSGQLKRVAMENEQLEQYKYEYNNQYSTYTLNCDNTVYYVDYYHNTGKIILYYKIDDSYKSVVTNTDNILILFNSIFYKIK